MDDVLIWLSLNLMMSSFDCPSIWWWPLTVRLVTWSESRAIIGTDSPKVGIGDQIKPDSSHPSKSKTPSTGFPSRDMTQPIITPHFLKRPSSNELHYHVWAMTKTKTHRLSWFISLRAATWDPLISLLLSLIPLFLLSRPNPLSPFPVVIFSASPQHLPFSISITYSYGHTKVENARTLYCHFSVLRRNTNSLFFSIITLWGGI